jgi:predicted nucleic acid-binding protein
LILYLDTSALVKLYAEEPGREEVQAAVEGAKVIAVSEIGYVEARSALARKEREGALSEEQHYATVEQLGLDFREVYLSRPATGVTTGVTTGVIIASAGEAARRHARRHALRAYDAIHLATARNLRSEMRELWDRRRESAETTTLEGAEPPRVLLMSYDASLAEAAREESLA